MHRTLFILLFTLSASGAVLAQEQAHVFSGARIHPVSGPVIERGVLVVRGGKILEVGEEGYVSLPAGAVMHDVAGRVIVPGLVDTHSHVGQPEGGDASAPLNPEVRALDAVDVRHWSIDRARAGGITTVNVMPGSGHLMSGQTVYLKLRDGDVIDDLLFCDDATTGICGGMKMANGTNALRPTPGAFPGTRARSAALTRQLFVEAQGYEEKIRRADGDSTKMPTRDLRLEAMGEVLDGRRVVHFHTHRHDDILTVLRLKEEFGFDVVLQHVSEGWKVADEIARAGVSASIIVIDSPGGKLEAVDMRFENGAVLDKAGVDVGFHTDDFVTDSRHFMRSAALAVRHGMPREKALEALTLAGARMLRLEDRIGSLQTGKDADFLVLSGDPFSVYTHMLESWVEGERVFDRKDPADYRVAVGGPGLGDGGHDDHGHR